MDIGKTLYVTNRKNWRAWLEKNFESEAEIWLVYPKKSSGKERILYNDAVEEALCFGWIDSIVKSMDEDHSVQRFSVKCCIMLFIFCSHSDIREGNVVPLFHFHRILL